MVEHVFSVVIKLKDISANIGETSLDHSILTVNSPESEGNRTHVYHRFTSYRPSRFIPSKTFARRQSCLQHRFLGRTEQGEYPWRWRIMSSKAARYVSHFFLLPYETRPTGTLNFHYPSSWDGASFRVRAFARQILTDFSSLHSIPTSRRLQPPAQVKFFSKRDSFALVG
jgi:hypothetical protein